MTMALPGCTSDSAPAAAYPLPFGLEHIVGTESLGRPALVEKTTRDQRGEEVRVRVLHAAYRVTSGDPVEVFREWVAQLGVLAITDVFIASSAESHSGAWLEAGGTSADDRGAALPTQARLHLWPTEEDPILTVDVLHGGRETKGDFEVEQHAGKIVEPPAVKGDPPAEGDSLGFYSGGDLHVPRAARALTPVLPGTLSITGGIYVVLSAEDITDAVYVLVDEARRLAGGG